MTGPDDYEMPTAIEKSQHHLYRAKFHVDAANATRPWWSVRTIAWGYTWLFVAFFASLLTIGLVRFVEWPIALNEYAAQQEVRP